MPDRAADTAAQARSRWSQRIGRAEAIQADVPAAAEILTFYAGLARLQQTLLDQPPRELAGTSFRSALDLEPPLAAVPVLLDWLSTRAPAALAARAESLVDVPQDVWRNTMRDYVADEVEAATDDEHVMAFVVGAAVQPVAEYLAIQRQPRTAERRPSDPGAGGASSICPMCGGAPVVGALREEGHGGRRGLVCGFCLTEWNYLRVVCPACDERTFDALPVFTSDTFPHVRIDACDTCRSYLKTVDLTRDGRAVPIVDDLATVTLDLWARERGYTRVTPNLLSL
jgi:formate dehydrogenase accessory protein FdhE